jgi:hypothetical protein
MMDCGLAAAAVEVPPLFGFMLGPAKVIVCDLGTGCTLVDSTVFSSTIVTRKKNHNTNKRKRNE